MNEQTFSLQPFPSSDASPNVKIAGNIARYENQFTIQYALLGDLKEIAFSPVSDTPERKQELWQETCFEFFLGIQNSDSYWEFNLSPSGDWNVYRFDAYRQGMQEEATFTALPFSTQYLSDGLALVVNIDLDKIVPADRTLELAIAAVIKQQNGTMSHWALAHQGTEADFHRRDSFIISL